MISFWPSWFHYLFLSFCLSQTNTNLNICLFSIQSLVTVFTISLSFALAFGAATVALTSNQATRFSRPNTITRERKRNGKWYWQRWFGVIGRVCLHSSPYVWMLRKKNNNKTHARLNMVVTAICRLFFVDYRRTVSPLRESIQFRFRYNEERKKKRYAVVSYMYANSFIFSLDSILVSFIFIVIRYNVEFSLEISNLYHTYTSNSIEWIVTTQSIHIAFPWFSSVFVNRLADHFNGLIEKTNDLKTWESVFRMWDGQLQNWETSHWIFAVQLWNSRDINLYQFFFTHSSFVIRKNDTGPNQLKLICAIRCLSTIIRVTSQQLV